MVHCILFNESRRIVQFIYRVTVNGVETISPYVIRKVTHTTNVNDLLNFRETSGIRVFNEETPVTPSHFRTFYS